MTAKCKLDFGRGQELKPFFLLINNTSHAPFSHIFGYKCKQERFLKLAIAKALAKYLGTIYEDKTWFTNCLAQVGAKALKIEYAFDYCITNSN